MPAVGRYVGISAAVDVFHIEDYKPVYEKCQSIKTGNRMEKGEGNC